MLKTSIIRLEIAEPKRGGYAYGLVKIFKLLH